MRTPSPSPLIGTATLSIAELSAARLDGELYPLAEMFCPVDLPPFPAVRAAGLAAELPEHAFVERLSAAWLHGALAEPPRPPQFALPSGIGARPRRPRAYAMRQVVIAERELAVIGGCRVTTPARTLVDVLLDDELSTERAIAVAAAIAATAGLSPAAARSALRSRYRLPNTALAEERIRRWAGG
ncbi:MAG: hypothetical protein ABWY30_04595 [Microterricola sp.]